MTEQLKPDHEDFYQALRQKVRDYFADQKGQTNKYAEYILIAPDLFHLLCRLAMDKEVSSEDKLKLVVAIAYFVSPMDIFPELFWGPVGFLDDISVAAFVLNSIINNTNPEVVRKHWAGEGDILCKIQNIINIADSMVGIGLWKRIRKMFN